MRFPSASLIAVGAVVALAGCSSGGTKPKAGTSATTRSATAAGGSGNATTKSTKPGPTSTVPAGVAGAVTPVHFSGHAIVMDPRSGTIAVQTAPNAASVLLVRASGATISGAATALTAIQPSWTVEITGSVEKIGASSVYTATRIVVTKPPPPPPEPKKKNGNTGSTNKGRNDESSTTKVTKK
jgi:hypothetical protein